MDAHERVATAIERLYAGVPEDFLSTRKELVAAAKAAGETVAAQEIGALRRPSLAAWVCNVIAREMTPVLEDLLEVGIGLREATRRGDLAAISSMRPDRDTAIDEMLRAAREVLAEAGRAAGSMTLEQVRNTAIAALADERAAQVVAKGSLVNPLSYSGFGEVDVTEAVARLADLPRPNLTVVASTDDGLADDGAAQITDPAPPADPGPASVDLAPLHAAVADAQAQIEVAEEVLEAAEAEVLEAERGVLLARQHRAEARRQVLAGKVALTDAQQALIAATPPPS